LSREKIDNLGDIGNERNPEKGDKNPFRYCEEYLDLETDPLSLYNGFLLRSNRAFCTSFMAITCIAGVIAGALTGAISIGS